jgi:hypothetical protein
MPISLDVVFFDKNLTIENIKSYIEDRQEQNWLEWDGGIDIRSMSLPIQIFTYLFRPLPFEAHNTFALLASLENVFLMYLFVLGLFSKFNGRIVSAHPQINSLFFLLYAFAALVILSMTTANFGINVRQKWMFLPFFIVLFISYITQRKKNNNLINQK